MGQDSGVLWYSTFFPNGIALGILGTLIPLYLIQELRASLVDLGLMVFAASILLIPASIYLGSLPDRYRMSKPFILASFLGVSVVLYLMTTATSVILFQALYVAKEFFTYLKGPSASVLIAESYERNRRSSVMARQGFIENFGGLVGLSFCVLTVDWIGYRTLLSITVPLVLASFIVGLLTIKEPPLYIERSLDKIDNVIEEVEDFSYHLTDRGTLAPDINGEYRFGHKRNMFIFGLGRSIFALATSNALTTLSIFLLQGAKFQSSLIFVVFQIRNLIGALGYLFVGRLIGGEGEKAVKIGTFLRVVVVGMLPVVLWLPMPYSVVAASILIALVALSWSVYSVGVGVIAVLYSAPGRLGLYDAMASLGGSVGNYSSGLIPTLYGFETLFVFSSILFILALILFYLSLK